MTSSLSYLHCNTNNKNRNSTTIAWFSAHALSTATLTTRIGSGDSAMSAMMFSGTFTGRSGSRSISGRNGFIINLINNSNSSNGTKQTTTNTNRFVSPTFQIRSLATQKKNRPKKNAAKPKKTKHNAKATAMENNHSNEEDDDSADAFQTHSSTPLQHEEWVQFQRAISVQGFETGQTTTSSVTQSSSSSRGSRQSSTSLQSNSSSSQRKKITRRNALAETVAERRRLTGAGGGEFPPLRYSEDETNRLLEMAYAAVPPRAGPRGTLRLKRQKKRWHLVREIHRKYKSHMAAFQVRKMAKRSWKVREVRAVLDTAAQICQQDRAYQLEVYRRWAATNNKSMGAAPPL